MGIEYSIHYFNFCFISITLLLVWFQVIRFIKHDIRINMGSKNVLNALSKDAYPSYQSIRDLGAVVEKYAGCIANNNVEAAVVGGKQKKVCQ